MAAGHVHRDIGVGRPVSPEQLTATAEIRVRTAPAKIFDAFADASQMSKYWFTRRDDGLREGEFVTWYLGPGENAYAFEIRVVELNRPSRIVIEWENGDDRTRVTWSIEETGQGNSIVRIVESGFTGDEESIIERLLDSTGGFNQVLMAAKALVEHDVEINVVADHV